MRPDKDTEHWLSLSLIRGLGDESLRRLLLAFQTPENVLRASRSGLQEIVSPVVAEAVLTGADSSKVETALNWLSSSGSHHLVTLADQDYPQLLMQTPDPPPVFYLRGRRELLLASKLAVVGSRNGSAQGIANAEAFSKSLSDSGLCIVSGLAIGIDAAAHLGGLHGRGSSIAVIGTGQDVVYPAKNKALMESLAENGAVISEFPLGVPAIASNFPRRNRVISGLSLGCLVVEAALQSGSHITARVSAELGREVFAIPGSIHSPLSKGCHALIKRGAKLAESSQDILEELRLIPALENTGAADFTLSEETKTLLGHLGFDPCNIDIFCERSGLSIESANAKLLQFEIAGLVSKLPSGLYQRILRY